METIVALSWREDKAKAPSPTAIETALDTLRAALAPATPTPSPPRMGEGK
jgi:hypothetical protein